MKHLKAVLFLINIVFLSCADTNKEINTDFEINKNTFASGEISVIKYNLNSNIDTVKVVVTNTRGGIVQTYPEEPATGTYIINRMFSNVKKENILNDQYFISVMFLDKTNNKLYTEFKKITMSNSVILESICHDSECGIIAGNLIEGTSYELKGKIYGVAASKITYNIFYLNEKKTYQEKLSSVTDVIHSSAIIFPAVPDNISSYIASINIVAEDDEGNIAETSLPIRIVRPLEVKHFGKYELAEVYDPVPVSGCIPGAVGNNITYSESNSETRQQSVSITVDRSWAESNSESRGNVSSEGISLGETQTAARSSSLSESETQSESYSNSSSTSDGNNFAFSTSDGENWSWSRGESQSDSESQSSSNGTSLGGSVTVSAEVGTEGSLPFLAKASGKVGTSVGVSAGVNYTDTTGETRTLSTNNGYSTGGTTQNGTNFGTSQTVSNGSSLSGSYSYNSSSTNNLSETNSDSSTRVWNMSESLTSGKVLTTGESERIGETIVTSSTDSVTLSYSAYLPRGRYGVFYRQTSRWVKLSEIITYDLNGVPTLSGYITMNEWSWAPLLSVGNSCEEVSKPQMDDATCFIPPCGG